jgi:hypothetical protein
MAVTATATQVVGNAITATLPPYDTTLWRHDSKRRAIWRQVYRFVNVLRENYFCKVVEK